MTGKIVLTSQGFFGGQVFPLVQEILVGRARRRAVIVTTAAEGRENDRFNIADQATIKSLGFERVDFVDLESSEPVSFSECNFIYVCGGNTFRLIRAARVAGFRASIEEVLRRGGVYMGVSCGSLILGPSVLLAQRFSNDTTDGLTDFSGLGLIPQITMPHYEDSLEPAVAEFEREHGVSVLRLRDGEAMAVDC